MFLVQLASGEEAAFRTVEEIALAIQSGIVTSGARLHVEGSWRPITEFDTWEEAQELVATLEPLETEELGAAPILPMPEVMTVPSPVRIYRMFSRSAQEMAERHRSAWKMPVAIGLAVVLLLVAVATSLRRPATDEPHIAALGHAAGTRSEAGALAGTPLDDGHAPFNLAARWNRWADSTNRAFADSARRLGLESVLSRSRLSSPESLEVSRQVLTSFRELLDHFRAAQVDRERAYWDSALALEQSGVWSASDVEEWRTRAPARRESPLAASRADSLNRNLDLLVDLLLREQGQYTLTGDLAHFAQPEAGREYDQLRTDLTLNADTHGLPPEHPLAVLLDVVQRNPLPPRSH